MKFNIKSIIFWITEITVCIAIFIILTNILVGCAIQDKITVIQHQQIISICNDDAQCITDERQILLDELAYEREERLLQHQELYFRTVLYCRQFMSYVMYIEFSRHCRHSDPMRCPPQHLTDSFACISSFRQ